MMTKKNYYFMLLVGLFPVILNAQELSVRGTVKRKDTNLAIAGVTVRPNLGNAVRTDGAGNYQILVKRNDTLSFSYLGMVAQRLVVTSDRLDVLLEPVQEQLDEVVVVGYGTIRKRDLTGAISSVKSEELTQLSSVDVNQSLQGRAAGVSVTNNSGEPGAGTKIRIRGIGSVNNSSPLYVVDGFPVDDISHIAPQDVESMQVLKDASAVAIYGSRGANGVILVTTKNGAFGRKTQVNVNAFNSLTRVAKKLDMLNASEYAILKLEAYKNANLTPSIAMQSILDYAIANNSVGTDWQDEIMQVGRSQNYNLNANGGSERNKFDLGGTYSRETGVIRNTFLEKFMFHLNNEYKLLPHVNVGLNSSYVTYKKSGNDGDFYSGSLTQALKADPVSAAWDSYTDQFGEIYFSYGRNPAQSVFENKYRKQSEDRFLVNGFLNIDRIGIDGLSFRAQYGRQFTFSKNKSYYPQYYITADQQRARSSLTENRSDYGFWNTSEYFNYVNTFGKHSINATLGVEAQKSHSNNMFGKVYDVPEDTDLQYFNMTSDKESLELTGGADHSALLSGFFRVNYSFDDRYLFTGTYRADGSSKFQKRWGYFPSFSVGWNILNEQFMEDIKSGPTLSQLKMRAGWGHVGNQASAGSFDYLSLMTNGYTAVFGGTQVDGAILKKLANRELSWETAESYNVGIDYGLFTGAVTGSVDYFVRNTNDMILATPIPGYVGMWRPNTNAGSVKNSGIEFSLNYDKTISDDFSFQAGFNLSAIKNKVTSLGGGEPLYGTYTKTEVGSEIATFFGLKSAGIFKTQEQLDAHVKDGKPIQPNAGLGDVMFVDQNNDGVIDDADRIYLGSAIPDFTYGISLGARFKQFDINVFMQGVQGNQIANYMYSVLYSTNMREWSNSKAMINRWSPENPDSDLPRVHSGDPNQNDRFSDRYVENGSYFRLRTLQLGYTFNKRSFLNKARVYCSVDNLLTITKYSGFNPEMGDLYGNPLNAGVDMASYPLPRVFTVGINLNLQ